MRIVFMGTPDFAVPSLKALVEAGHEVCGVFTQPDKPKNRGMKLQQPPVKEYALSAGLPVFQPAKLRDGEALEILRALKPELIAVAAYGKILPADILELPSRGCVNVHSSLLPKYRGAAPINWAILNGDDETGVTIMYMAEGMDTGDILAQAVTPMLSKELSPMDWSRTVRQLHDQVRGLYPWPAAVAVLDGIRCKVLCTVLLDETTDQAPGTILQADKKGLRIACGGGGVLELSLLQPDGKKAMAASAFLMGHPMETGTVLTD